MLKNWYIIKTTAHLRAEDLNRGGNMKNTVTNLFKRNCFSILACTALAMLITVPQPAHAYPGSLISPRMLCAIIIQELTHRCYQESQSCLAVCQDIEDPDAYLNCTEGCATAYERCMSHDTCTDQVLYGS